MKKRHSDGKVEIAVIGVHGSGKTTLAAGLYASSSEDFTVGAKDDMTRSYLEKVKSELQEGRWPESTPQDQRPSINLLVHEGAGRSTSISFKDYMGDLVGSDVNFLEDYVGSPDGAMLLFNPGMGILSDTQERNRMISLYKKAIDHLYRRGCRHVALVVTAADRLEGDLRDRREELSGYEKEIADYLESVGGKKWWRRIPVSVAVSLESQNAPSLAVVGGNTASRPFRYLLEELRKDDSASRRRKLLTRLGLVAFLAALAAVGLAVRMFYGERSRLGELERTIDDLLFGVAKVEGEAEIVAVENSICGLAPTFHAGRSARLREKWEAAKPEIRRLLDVKTLEGLQGRLVAAKGLSYCIGIQREATRWSPFPGNERRWADFLRDVDRDCRRFAEMEWRSFETGSPTNATEKAVGEFAENIREWAPAADETRAVRAGILARLPDNAVTWCTDYKIRGIGRLVGRGDLAEGDVVLLLNDILRVPMTNGCSATAIEKNYARLSEARTKLVDAFIASYAKRAWGPESDDSSPDEWCAASLAGLDKSGQVGGNLRTKERERVEKMLASAREDNKGAWYRRQEEVAKAFLAKFAAMSAVDACTEYGAFCSDHPRSPGLDPANGKVRAAFLAKVEKAFREYKAHYDAEFCGSNRIYATSGDVSDRIAAAEERFKEFSALCQLLPKNASGTLDGTKCFEFAKAARSEMAKGQKGAFAQSLAIEKMEIRFEDFKNNDYHNGFNVDVWSHVKGTDNYCDLLKKTNYDNDDLKGSWLPCAMAKDRVVLAFNAWTEPEFTMHVEGRVKLGRNRKGDWKYSLKDFPGNGEETFRAEVSFQNSVTITLKLSGKVTGRGFLDLWREHIGEL